MLKITIDQEGFYGFFHEPKNPIDYKKAVIVLGGSEGNENIPINLGAKFATNGLYSLGVCYWNVENLPKQLVSVPIDSLERAVFWLKNRGFKKIFIYGISKGGELALLCASLMKDISGVIAISPSHCVWSGLKGSKNIFSKRFVPVSEFSYKGKDFPFMMAKLTYGPAIRHFILDNQMDISYIYKDALSDFDEKTAINVENIKGDVLFIYSKNDTMWPSEESVNYMIERLNKHSFNYKVDVLSYEKASHILIPINTKKFKLFKIEKNYPKECKRNREDAFRKTIEWITNK